MDDRAISVLLTTAERTGDLLLVAVCCRALSGMVPYRDFYALSQDHQELVARMGQKEARRWCARSVSAAPELRA